MRTGFLSFLWLTIAASVQAAPYTPADDAQILARIPAGAARGQSNPLRELQAQWRRDPADLETAAKLAQAQITLARTDSDPRYLGHAQATLKTWWSAPNPPERVLLLRATIKQSNHQFEPAVADLEAALRANPRDAQAWLTLSTVQLVIGRIAAARASCERLRNLTAPLVYVTCTAGADGLSGQAQLALATLEAAQLRGAALPRAVRSWSATLAGEIAERLGRLPDAERQYRDGITLDPEDVYARNALADFLLVQGRAAEARAVLPKDAGKSDPTLLRIAIAARRTGDAQAPALEESLFARLAASRERGEALHLREEARALLELHNDARGALELAQRNWQIQKEAADARLLLAAAVAARDQKAAEPVLAWMRENKVEDTLLTALASGLNAK
jgi:thioredoxin-like negative regulator of GroEL